MGEFVNVAEIGGNMHHWLRGMDAPGFEEIGEGRDTIDIGREETVRQKETDTD